MKINKKKGNFYIYLLGLEQYEGLLSIDGTNIAKNRPISPARHVDNTPAIERISFSLEKEVTDDDKDEVVYSATSNIM
jgi:hypothetical protein